VPHLERVGHGHRLVNQVLSTPFTRVTQYMCMTPVWRTWSGSGMGTGLYTRCALFTASWKLSCQVQPDKMASCLHQPN
jgi:hypothetical protein